MSDKKKTFFHCFFVLVLKKTSEKKFYFFIIEQIDIYLLLGWRILHVTDTGTRFLLCYKEESNRIHGPLKPYHAGSR
jgi:hypothetical protein